MRTPTNYVLAPRLLCRSPDYVGSPTCHVGTPRYMDPDLLYGGRDNYVWAPIYDVGAPTYHVRPQIFCDIASIWFLAATKQLYEWYFLSVPLSVCPSVCLSVTPFSLCSHHRIIMKFSGVISNDQGNVHAKGQGQRSKVKVTTQLNCFRTVTPVWIH